MNRNKKMNIIFTVAVVLLAGILIFLMAGLKNNNPVKKHQKLGYDYLQKGQYGDALGEFEAIISNKDQDIDALIGKALCYIKMERTENAISACEEAIDLVIYGKEKKYPQNYFEEIVMWWAENAPAGDDFFEVKLNDIVKNCNIISSFEWSEPLYEDEEPHQEYEILIIDGKETKQVRYTGNYATVEWHEDKNNSDYEVKYVNGEKTDEKRMKSSAKPKKDYTDDDLLANCPECGYSANSDPGSHPGHGLEGIRVFERVKKLDGTWGFLVEFE